MALDIKISLHTDYHSH